MGETVSDASGEHLSLGLTHTAQLAVTGEGNNLVIARFGSISRIHRRKMGNILLVQKSARCTF